MDLMGPFPSGENLLAVVDYYSRYQEVAIVKRTTSNRIITQLEAIFARHGLPRTIRSDNGPQFVSEEFKNFLGNNGINTLEQLHIGLKGMEKPRDEIVLCQKRLKRQMQKERIGKTSYRTSYSRIVQPRMRRPERVQQNYSSTE